MDRFYDVKKRLVDMAAQSSDVSAVIVIGSQTRSIEKADEYSDLDIILITDRPRGSSLF